MPARKRIGHWQQTFAGRKFWPLDPDPADVCIEDIAHALSLICRFGGHTGAFYSVAQHSCLVSDLLPPPLQLEGLLHDATETYCGDMVQPLKASLPVFRHVEEKIWIAVAQHFGLPVVRSPQVKAADLAVLMAEKRDLLPHALRWSDEFEAIAPMATHIEPMPPEVARAMFLNRFERLTQNES